MSVTNKFDWDFSEAETVDRLKALATTGDMLFRKGMMDDLNGVKDPYRDWWSTGRAVEEIESSLKDYGENKGYDLIPYLKHSNNLLNDLYKTPLMKEHNRFSAEKREAREAEVAIDESQFEIPNQSQKTL